jgi:catechol 2,3-dioxygenase-like lactoylglutathione lyase family enzyme
VASRIGEIIVDCADPEEAAAFWCAALDYRIVERGGTEVTIAGHSGAPTILFDVSPDVKLHKNRIHFDIHPIDTTQAEEVSRLVDLGARLVDIGQTDASWVVMEDPTGNEFCVMSTEHPTDLELPDAGGHATE